MSKKKIALLGNMNNNFNALCRYLRDMGHDAQLFIFDYEVYPHFHPSADCYDDSWKIYTTQLKWGSAKSYSKVTSTYLKEFFHPFDIIIGSGYAPAFAKKAGRTLDIFIPHGSDLNELPYPLGSSLKDIVRYLYVGRSQKQGIRNARHLISDLWPAHKERKIEQLRLRGKRHMMSIPFLYWPQYQHMPKSTDTKDLSRIKELKERSDILLFQHIRHSWKNTPDPKGNDILIRGLRLFLTQHPKVKVNLVTFEYGNDVSLSKELIKELDLQRNVHWFPLAHRKEIMRVMSYADIVVGELHDSFCTYGAVVEAMLSSKPVMHRRDDYLYLTNYNDLYDMIHASSAEEVAAGIAGFLTDPAKYAKMGLSANKWIVTNLIDEPLKTIFAIIQE